MLKISKDHVPALDGFRGIAIILVILSHYGLGKLVPGGFGVNLFFFVSGLLITRLLIIEKSQKGAICLKSFYIRRFLRLYPALIFFTIIGSIYILTLGFNYFRADEIFSTLFYYRNYLPYVTDYSYPPKEFNVFHIVWSLAIEEHFYIVFPCLFILLYKRTRLFIGILIALIAAALLWRISLIGAHGGLVDYHLQQRIHYLTDSRFDAMLFGCLMSVLLASSAGDKIIKNLGNPYVIGLGIGMIILSIAIRSVAFRESWRYTLQGLAFCMLIPPVLHHLAFKKINLFLCSPWLVTIGKLSYSLYLFHWLGLCVASYYFSYNRTDLPWLVTATTVTVVLSYISYNYIEVPTMALRKKFGSNVTVPQTGNIDEVGSIALATK